jgi:hypothetical protein
MKQNYPRTEVRIYWILLKGKYILQIMQKDERHQ